MIQTFGTLKNFDVKTAQIWFAGTEKMQQLRGWHRSLGKLGNR